MDIEIKRQLQAASQRLSEISTETPKPEQATREIMQGLAVALDALQALASDVEALREQSVAVRR